MAPRTRSKNHHLPRRMRVSSAGTYYYDHGPGPDGKRRWERLGRDLAEAKIRWAQIEAERNEQPPARNTVAALLDYYRKQHLPQLAERTQRDRRAILETLNKVFGHMRPGAVRPQDVAAYLEEHDYPVAANREIAVLSTVYRKGMRVGLVDTNPCDGVERNPEKPRDRYVTDAEFLAVKALADDWMQAVMDLAYLTGMRQGDLLALERRQVDSEGIHLRQAKTGQRQIIERTPALDDVLQRLQRARPVAGMRLLCTKRGQPYSESGFKALWQRLARSALDQGVLEERFTFHDIRAKSATDAEQQGLDPQRLLGHTSRNQTETYLRSRRAIRIQPVDPGAKGNEGEC